VSTITENINEYRKYIDETSILIGIDYGEKKIGLALSSPSRTIALPLAIIENSKNNVFNKLQEFIQKHNVSGFVLGIPVNMDGSYGESANKVKKFAEKLAQNTQIPIYLQDERRTSKAANSLLMYAGYNRKQRNEMDDSIAASLILETALKRL